jgi:4-amino-4-deoxy-L-arabinose transferase-like glycosyltransferase
MMANKFQVLRQFVRARLNNNAIDIAVLLLTPAFLCLVVPDWIFSPIPTIDPYLYLGYIRNFSHLITIFGNTYYASRLPFIIPGYICYKIFPPLVANYVFHLGFYYLAIFSLYFILRIAVNRRTALLTAALMGFYPYFLAAVGWDYIDGAGIAYFLLTLLLLTLAVKNTHGAQTASISEERGRTISNKCALLLFLAGISLAALIYTNIFLFIMIPSLALFYFVMQPQSWKTLFMSALIVIDGAILATILLGIVSTAAGGSFLFFKPSIHMVSYFRTVGNVWLYHGNTWLLYVPFMVLPFFICLTSLAFLIVSILHVKSDLFKMNGVLQVARDNIFGLLHLLNFLIMFVLQLLGQPVFQLQYYASYLMPTAFLAAGQQIYSTLSHLSVTQFRRIAIITISLLAGSYLLYYRTPIHSILNYPDSMWYVFAVLVAGALCLIVVAKRKQILNMSLVILAAVFFSLTPITLIATNPHRIVFCACEQGKNIFLAVTKSDDISHAYDTTGNLRFWYNNTEPLGGLFTAIASTHFWAYRLINYKFPDIVKQNIPGHTYSGTSIKLPPETDIVILSSDEDALSKATTALNGLGLQVHLIGTEEISQGPINFTMTFIRTTTD